MLRYKEIKNLVTQEIAKLNSNDRLPPRSVLCKKLDTTRTTLDRAINELVTEGVLYARRGGGTYVAGAGDQLTVHAGQSWGVIIRDVADAFYARIVRSVEDIAQSQGINIILCNSDYDSDKQEQYIKRLSHSGVSGIIIFPVVSKDIHDDCCLYSQLTEAKVPFVFCARNTKGNVPVVISNDFYGGYIATKHLLEKGYRNIAYISYMKYWVSYDRCQGYISALQDNKMKVDRKMIAVKERSQPQLFGYEAMQEILASGRSVDAVFCFNDKLVQGVYQAITEAGLAVSDDIGVVGYDNSDISDKFIPALTSVDYNPREMGTKIAEALNQQIAKEDSSDFQFYVIKPNLVVRDSCRGPKKA
jgi:DNA-binding LacI/PurR family transcriptional regulator